MRAPHKRSSASVKPEPLPPAQMEKRVLGALCGMDRRDSLRQAARVMLSSYRWAEPMHEIIFEAILSLPTAGRDALSRELPAWLTRRGFPDFDLQGLSHAVSAREARDLMRQLAGLGDGRGRKP